MGLRKFLLTCFVVMGWLPIPVSALEFFYTPEEKFAMSQAVFVGRVLSVRGLVETKYDQTRIAHIEVIKWLKRPVDANNHLYVFYICSRTEMSDNAGP